MDPFQCQDSARWPKTTREASPMPRKQIGRERGMKETGARGEKDEQAKEGKHEGVN